MIASHRLGCISVHAGSTNAGHEFVELIGDSYFRTLIGERVDKMIDRFAAFGVGRCAIELIEGVDSQEVRTLRLIIGSTITLSALEHDMLLVVGETCRFERIVLRSCADHDIRQDLRFLFVLGQIDRETVIEGIDTRLERVSLYGTIGILFGGKRHAAKCCECQKEEQAFHLYRYID